MATKKNKGAVKLSDELTKAVDELVGKSTSSGGNVTEDDIQVALRDIDVDGDELSDLYDALRARGVDVTSAGEAEVAVLPSVDDDDFGSDLMDDDLDDEDAYDDEDGDYEAVSEAKAADPDNEAGHRDLSFEEYIRICQTVENGTLEPLT